MAKCSFCGRSGGADVLIGPLALCPICLRRMMGVSPADREYVWFLAAVRRALSA